MAPKPFCVPDSFSHPGTPVAAEGLSHQLACAGKGSDQGFDLSYTKYAWSVRLKRDARESTLQCAIEAVVTHAIHTSLSWLTKTRAI